MKLRYIFILVLTFAISLCNGQPSKNIESFSPKTFAEKINETPKAQILDVRTPEEFTLEHIKNAENINWLGDNFVTSTEKYDKSKPVFVYCKSGARSEKASKKLQELGFKTVYQLEGGLLKWNAANLSKPSDKIIGMCSQEYEELLNTDKKVLIDFYTEWCAPCKKMAPYLLQMQKDLVNKVVIVRLNADENKTLINKMKIDKLPSLILYQNKKVIWKHSGFISKEDLKKQL